MTESHSSQRRRSGRSVSDPHVFGKVAVLYGGDSAEREVSLESGAAVLDGLRQGGIDAHGVDKATQVLEQLSAGGFDRVFIALHGRGGEDGTLQGALEVAGYPYTGSGVLGSALAMDKYRTKCVWQALGVPTPAFHLIRSETELLDVGKALGYPLIVKPVHEGSSIGAGRVENDEELHSAWWTASGYDAEVIAEPWLEGPEYTVSILGSETLPVIRLETPRVFYDYEAKYADDAGTRYHCPCGLAPKREREFQRLAMRAFEAVGGYGWGRVDLICDDRGRPQFIDVNTVPGMTSHSLVPMAARAAGIEFDELVWRILETSWR